MNNDAEAPLLGAACAMRRPGDKKGAEAADAEVVPDMLASLFTLVLTLPALRESAATSFTQRYPKKKSPHLRRSGHVLLARVACWHHRHHRHCRKQGGVAHFLARAHSRNPDQPGSVHGEQGSLEEVRGMSLLMCGRPSF